MQRHRAAAATACLSLISTFAFAQPSFELTGRYTTGLADIPEEVTAGETAVLRHGRLYVTNADDVSVDIVSVANPKRPTRIKRVDLKAFGKTVNSVDVSKFHVIAAAVDDGVNPGVIVFISPWGSVLHTVQVGAIPDMVAFTPDGTKLLVANEGEPDCYDDPDCTDPEGSVSIINVLPFNPTAKTVRFDQVGIPAGVRLFGPEAAQEQDLEPEYLTISADSRTAYVTLQENNAIAVVDVRSATVTAVHALGYKDWNAPPEVDVFTIDNLPSIGKTLAGQDIKLGGFSGLFYEGMTPSGKLKFVTHTDRGPNGEPDSVPGVTGRPFLLPEFAPRLVRLQLDPNSGQVSITQQILLRRQDGTPLTGLPNTAVPSGGAATPHNDEKPVNLLGGTEPLDPLGGDFEGIAVDPADGSFWMADEYRPAIYHFNKFGVLLQRYVPVGAHAAAGLTPPALGIEALPAVLAQRRQNRGFEALVQQDGKIYAFVQSPLRNPVSPTPTFNQMKNIRIVELEPTTLETRQFLYVLDQPVLAGAGDTIADKIGDATALPGGGFLALERDDDATPEDVVGVITKRIYAFSLDGATNVTGMDGLFAVSGGSKSIDQMTIAELEEIDVSPVAKVLHLDVATAIDDDGDAYNGVEKIEGLALIDANTIVLVNDNDFGVASITINPDGTFTPAPGYTPETEQLAIISGGGFDASDRDNVVNIRPWPVYGMYQPDAIASFVSRGVTYLITANEGDAREYDGLEEESRGSGLADDYPEIEDLLSDGAQLGRLNFTTETPDMSRPYTFGARSISIWNARTGELVWDSGSDLEVLVAEMFPENFNADNGNDFDDDDLPDNFDSRSDNKGPEPEGIEVGTIGGRTYAFVTLERIGGVVTYDITDPRSPELVDYFNDRDFNADPVAPDAGPEVVRFVSALESPNGRPMLVVANEVSGTVSLFSLRNSKPWWHYVWKPWKRRHW